MAKISLGEGEERMSVHVRIHVFGGFLNNQEKKSGVMEMDQVLAGA